MTKEERNIKLKHFIACMKCSVSGKVCDDNCPTQYEAGNTGEIIENLEAISKILEQEPKVGHWINKKPRWIPSLSMTIQDAYECSNCGEPGVHWWKRCIYCGAPMEIEEWMKPIIEGWRHDRV